MLTSYPWYLVDWLASRSRAAMTLEERGLYREVLDLCYQSGSVPSDEKQLRRLVCADEKEWRRAWPAVRSRFVLTPTGDLTHPRVQENLPVLLSAAEGRSKSSSMAAKARWKKHNSRIANSAGIDASGNAPDVPGAMRDACQTQCGDDAAECGIGEAVVDVAVGTVETHSAAVLVPGRTATPARDASDDRWREYVGLFLAGGKKLNEHDLARALRQWLSLSADEQGLAIADARETVAGRASRFIPLPVNHLTDKPWTRIGPGRILPAPSSESKGDRAQREAERLFDAAVRNGEVVL